EHGPALDHLALEGGPGAQPAAYRAGREVRLRLRLRDALDPALDAHLPALLVPVEDERRVGVLGELPGLATAGGRVEGKAAVVDALVQHQPGRRLAVGRRRRHRHRVERGDAGVARLGVPALELPGWIGVEVTLL